MSDAQEVTKSRKVRMRMEFDFEYTPEYYPEEMRDDPAECLRFDLEADATATFDCAITLDDESIEIADE